MIVEETALIPAPPEQVFSYVVDLSTVADYNPDVVEARPLGPGPTRVGSEFRLVVRLFGLRLASTLRVVRLDPPRELVLEARSLVDAREVRTFTPVEGGTELAFRIEFASGLPLLGSLVDRWLLAPPARHEARLELTNLRARFAGPAARPPGAANR